MTDFKILTVPAAASFKMGGEDKEHRPDGLPIQQVALGKCKAL